MAALCSPLNTMEEILMSNKVKKIPLYTVLILVIGSLAFYASMEDYQKENMSKLISQTFSG